MGGLLILSEYSVCIITASRRRTHTLNLNLTLKSKSLIFTFYIKISTMKKLLLLPILALLFCCNCNKQNIEKDTPNCIKKKINVFSKESSCNDATVKRYIFQDKNVFVFEPGTCGADMSSEVVSEDCLSLGMLGGITGNTEINGEDFSKATLVKVIWKK